MKKRWTTYDKKYDNLNAIMKEFGLSEIVARALMNRDMDTVEKVRGYLDTDIKNLHNPLLLKGMEKAAERVKKAVAANEKICIYGDYDVDGVTSTALSVRFLKHLGADVVYYIPARMEEGYGLNKEAVLKLHEQGIELIITVDCGIRSVDVVALANEIGIEMIITDHHECGETLPDAYCIINPHQSDCPYPFKQLAGVGVAFKLMDALAQEFDCREALYDMIDIVAVGTVADVVPLIGENRTIVKNGLNRIADTQNKGIRALLDICGIQDTAVSAYHIAFMIAPRINAAGRLADASLCVKLLLTEDRSEAEEIARQLDTNNKERQSIENQILESALRKIEAEADLEKDRIIVLDDSSWHRGIVGIVASRIVERYYMPTVLLSKDDTLGRGSARSIPGFNIYEAMSACNEFFEKFGGHEQAAGVTLKIENIAPFREKIKAIAAETIGDEKRIPEIRVDFKLSPRDVCMETARQLKILEPFGAGNSNPLYVFRSLKVLNTRAVGAEGKHLSLSLHDGFQEIKCIGYNLGNFHNVLPFGEKVDIICSVEINNWNNMEKVQLNIKDIKISKK